MQFSNAEDPIDFTSGGIRISFKAPQFLNRPFWIESTDDDKQISTRSKQPLKAKGLILFTEEGIDTFFNEEQPQKAFSPIDFNEDSSSNSIDSSDEQPMKAFDSISATDDGMDMCLRDEHSPNADEEIKETEEGDSKITSDKEAQFSKADWPINLREEGKVILVSEMQSMKANSSMSVRGDWIDIWLSKVHLEKVPFWILVSEGKVSIDISDEQLQKAFSPIEVTDDGCSNTTCDKERQQSKALFSIDWTEEGIVIVVNDEHPWKEDSPIKDRDELASNKTLDNDRHELKESFSIKATEEGMKTFVSKLQSLKAPLFIDVTDCSISKFERDIQPSKEFSISLTEESTLIKLMFLSLVKFLSVFSTPEIWIPIWKLFFSK